MELGEGGGGKLRVRELAFGELRGLGGRGVGGGCYWDSC